MEKKAFDLSNFIGEAGYYKGNTEMIDIDFIKKFIKILKEFKSKNNETGEFDYLLIPIERFNKLVGKKLK